MDLDLVLLIVDASASLTRHTGLSTNIHGTKDLELLHRTSPQKKWEASTFVTKARLKFNVASELAALAIA